MILKTMNMGISNFFFGDRLKWCVAVLLRNLYISHAHTRKIETKNEILQNNTVFVFRRLANE